MFAFELKELQSLSDQLYLFTYNKFNLFSIYDKDYFFPGNNSLYSKVINFLDEHYPKHSVKDITLVSTPRYFNYAFNPVSFYYGFDKNKTLNIAIAEVTNTYKETYLYVLDDPKKNKSSSSTCFKKDKTFHVSPFFDEKGAYNFKFSALEEDFSVQMTYSVNKETILVVDVFF
tara:strand:- start:3461 stop:3979 length:519 start_codon:yes stop_codon:yes gene_type:complete